MALRRQRGGAHGSRVSLFMDPPRYTEQVIQGEWLVVKDDKGRVELGETLAKDWWQPAEGNVMAVAEKLKRSFTFADVMNRTDGYSRKEIRRVFDALTNKKRLIELGKENRKGGAVLYKIPDSNAESEDLLPPGYEQL